MGVTEYQRPRLSKDAVGTFLLWSGTVVFASAMIIGLFNFGTSWLTYGPAAAGLLTAALGLFLSMSRLTSRLSQRKVQFIAITTGYVGALLLVLIALNVLLLQRPVVFDLTAQQVHSLSDQSRELLSALDTDVRITVFVEKSDPIFGLYEKYKTVYEEASPKVTFRRFSPSQDIEAVRQYKVTADSPPFVAESRWDDDAQRREDRFRLDLKALNHEGTITNAIRSAALSDRTQIVILGGHGEADPLDAGPSGMSEARRELADEGYEVVPVNLVVAQRIPPKAKVVIIPGVSRPLLGPEKIALKAYMEQGGNVLLMLESQADHGLDDLLGGYGIQANADLVLDISPFGRMYGERTAIAVDYGRHPITEKFKNAMSIFPGARSLSINPGTDTALVPLLRTGERAWGETDFEGLANGDAEWDAGEARGPVTLAIAAERTLEEGETPDEKKVGRLVVTGDSTFATNENRKLGANRDLFMNMVAWLAVAEDQITIRPHVRGFNFITLTPAQRDGIAFFVLYLLPTLLLSVGLGVWFARKGR